MNNRMTAWMNGRMTLFNEWMTRTIRKKTNQMKYFPNKSSAVWDIKRAQTEGQADETEEITVGHRTNFHARADPPSPSPRQLVQPSNEYHLG
ncbi:hypothetical protein RUM44_004081 [Polyplax serrata]|uniref:Uncharacterized protein n=1 Tax=Polyplax serrata TaxID=468196 RepID=A0ABR1B1T8_POLSC